MPATNSIFDCRRFCDAIVTAGGEVPKPLANLLAGADLIDGHSAAPAPLMPIVEAMAAGKLTSAKLSELVEAAAQQRMIADTIGDLRRAAEPQIVKRFHQALRDGAADTALDSLRKKFAAAAEQIAHAKSVIGSGESTPEHVLNTGTSETVEVWQQLPRHLATVAGIAAIASQFGCGQTAAFGLVEPYHLAENFRIHDYAVACTTGSLVGDSMLFQRPDQGHTTSPFYRCGGLKLHSIEEMQARYDSFASAEFDRVHTDRRSGRLIDGQIVPDPVPVNPYRDTAEV